MTAKAAKLAAAAAPRVLPAPSGAHVRKSARVMAALLDDDDVDDCAHVAARAAATDAERCLSEAADASQWLLDGPFFC